MLERLSQLLLREPKDRQQLVDLLREAEQRHLLDEHALNMIEGVLQVSEMQVRDIMVPRTQMILLSENNTLAEILPVMIHSQHSRFPVIDTEGHQIIGILLAKDLLPFLCMPKMPLKLKQLLRKPAFVPESKRLNLLLQEFRLNHTHMAIVIDEYGGISGLVTIEDVLEQIVGDIEDEHDFNDEAFIKKHDDVTYIIKAQTPVAFFNDYFQSALHLDNLHNSTHQTHTVGDIVLKAFSRLPKRGESITIENFRFKVLHANNSCIRLLRLRKVNQL